MKITREQVLEEAKLCFSQNGYTGTTLRTIAKGLNVTHNSLLYYFPSKSAIGMEITKEFYSAWFRATDNQVFLMSVTPELRNGLQSILFYSYCEKHRDFARFYVELVSENVNCFLTAMQSVLLNYLTANMSINYEYDSVKAQLDVYLLADTCCHLIDFIRQDRISVKDAAQYAMGLCCHSWGLKLSADEIEQMIQSIYRTELIEDSMDYLERNFCFS